MPLHDDDGGPPQQRPPAHSPEGRHGTATPNHAETTIIPQCYQPDRGRQPGTGTQSWAVRNALPEASSQEARDNSNVEALLEVPKRHPPPGGVTVRIDTRAAAILIRAAAKATATMGRALALVLLGYLLARLLHG